ncbi:MAG: DUF3617 family protein [Proteobacteria bacterium]|nr:DUF3617 family protein [Pseudomonadota bacterium]
MRPILWFLGSLAILGTAGMPAFGDNAGVTLPERKAGLWELRTQMDEGKGAHDQTMKLCVDAKMEKDTVLASIADHKENCSTYNIKASDDHTVVDADCLYNGRKVVSTTNMSGDFQSTFAIDIKSTTTDPSETRQDAAIKREITQLGKFVGESCGDLKPGEAEATDGSRIQVQ